MTTTTTTGIDIAAFRALSRDEQALRWRTYSYETKFELCREARRAMSRSYTSDVVDEAVAHWDRTFATVAARVAPEPTTAPAYTTITHRIAYDRDARDYACYVQVGGDPEQYIGSTASYHEGEIKCLDYKRDLLDGEALHTASELDGGGAYDDSAYATPEQIAQRDAENDADMDDWLIGSSVTTVPIGECYVCGAAGWAADNHGPLCPDHAGVLREHEAGQLEHDVVYARPAEEAEPIAAGSYTLTRTYRLGQLRCREYVATSDGGEPLDRFSVYYSDGVWYAWTGDTISQDRIAARQAFAQSLAPEPYDDTLTIAASRLDGQCGDCGQTLDGLGLCRCRELTDQDAREIAEVLAPVAPVDTWLFCSVCRQLGLFLSSNGRCEDCQKRPRLLTFHPAAPAFSISAPRPAPTFGERLTDQASDLLTRLIAEKTHLIYLLPHSVRPYDARMRQERIARLTGCINRAAARLGRRFVAMPVEERTVSWGS
jgi:hypothetical protein